MRKLGTVIVALFFLIGLTSVLESAAAEKQTDVVEKAKKEGSLISYTTANTGDQSRIYKAFNQRYPFIKAEGVKIDMESWTDRIAAERAANRYISDVAWGGILAIASHIKKGFLVPYSSPERSVLPDGFKDKEGLWSVYGIGYITAGYNTNLVKPADVPKTWDDLALPKWKGKTVGDDYNIDLLSAMIAAWGQEKAMVFWKKVAANGIVLVKGRSNQTKLLEVGEYAIGIGLQAHDLIKESKKGAPVRWINSLNPMPALLQGIGIYKNAPHPNAARLFVDWILSAEGQQVFVLQGRIPARPGLATEAVLAPGVKVAPVGPELADKERELYKLYRDAMGIKQIGQ